MLCTLWGNMLLLDVPGNALAGIPFAARMISMAFSILGFVAVFLVARAGSWRRLRARKGLLFVSAALSSLGSLVHFGGFDWLPGSVDLAALAILSVFFAFPLVACGELYAQMRSRDAIVYAGLSYFLAWVGCALLDGMGAPSLCVVAAVLPLLVALLAVSPTDEGEGERARPASLVADVRMTLEAIPLNVLAALAVTYFALGSTWARAGSPQDYFQLGAVLPAAVTSLAVMGVCLALRSRISLAGVYKVLMVVQVLAAFLLSEWAVAAQVALVITLVGVKIVAWALMAELARGASARGVVTSTAVYALGCLSGHIGEGVAGVIGGFGEVSQGVMTGVVVVMLMVAAAFLFTGQGGKVVAAGEPGAVPAGRDGFEGPAEWGLSDAQLSSSGERTVPEDDAPDGPDDRARSAEGDRESRIERLAEAYLLSERETDVFRLWATGHTLKYIQSKLFLSQSTVKTHVRHIYEKTGLHSRAEVVALLDDDSREAGERDDR